MTHPATLTLPPVAPCATPADPAPWAESYNAAGLPLYNLRDFLPCRIDLIGEPDADNAELLTLLNNLVRDIDRENQGMRGALCFAGYGLAMVERRRRLMHLGLRLAALCADEV